MRSALVAFAAVYVFAVGSARAQGTAPPTPATPAEAPARQAELSETKSKLASVYDEFRNFKNRLPFTLGAGVYLFYYQPLDNTTFSPTDKNGSFQLYAFYLKLDSEWHGFGGHAELRARDGGHIGPNSTNQYLRSFFTSNLWFQEVYAYYRPWSLLNLKAGKIYRKVGVFWDDSFFGNLQYFDGNKLVPDWGLSVEGARDFLAGKLGLEYSAQYFYNSGGTNGSLDYGRTVGAAPDQDPANARSYSPTAIGQSDSAGNRIAQLKHVIDARVALTLRPCRKLALTAGLSGLNARILRQYTAALTKTPISDESQYSQVAAELTLSAGPSRGVAVRLLAEYLHQFGPGMRDADYLLAGGRATWRDLALYLNASYVRYDLHPAVREFILQPGVSYAIGGGLAVLAEYDEWQRADPRGVAFPLQAATPGTTTDYYPVDRSLNLVLVYSY